MVFDFPSLRGVATTRQSNKSNYFTLIGLPRAFSICARNDKEKYAKKIVKEINRRHSFHLSRDVSRLC